ncbi:hypothetical protein [Chondromyces apiculatus]|uniref:Uncharacterized protein n=1 Tax=Chondromyces apiculatus DSM 436 TaxID=1192034 RepID=A0A017TCW4_9BACT|nr:hypothetical protein [Chondromyces apiculatus]EYF06772.1 Hypothetical protein CAP_1469 [Chondromyces apiculatus DSM 436]
MISARELIALLTPTLGHERSREAVHAAARDLGLRGDALVWSEEMTRAGALAVLDLVAQAGGLQAMAAQFARTQVLKWSKPKDAPVSVRPPALKEEHGTEESRGPASRGSALRAIEARGADVRGVGGASGAEDPGAESGDAEDPDTSLADGERGANEAGGSVATIAVEQVKALLAPTLGTHKSAQIVDEATRSLGFERDELTLSQAMAVLDRLGTTAGIVGVTARFASARLPRVMSQRESGIRGPLTGQRKAQ